MSAPGSADVLAVIAAGPELADAARRAWDRGAAILPINPGFAAAEIATLLERLRPAPVDGSQFEGGMPAPPDTAAIVVTSGTEGVPKGVELTRVGMDVMGR